MKAERTRTVGTSARLVVGVALLGLVPNAGATVLVPADFAELVRQAQVVVHGRVVQVAGVWADGRRRVDTLVTLDAVEYFKGDFGPTVTFRVPGGELGRYRSIVIGAPVFEPGDEVVLLLGARGPSMPYVLGLNQGVFRVVTSAATGQKLVVPPPLLPGAEAVPVRRGDPARRPVSLARFSDEVERVLASRAAQSRRGARGTAADSSVKRLLPSGGVQ